MKKTSCIHLVVIVLLIALAIACGVLTASSLSAGKLYSPFGILAVEGKGSGLYLGISVYITIGATSLTSSLIRIALRLSK